MKQEIIYAELLRRIERQIYPIDGHILTEIELAEEFQSSRGTVGRAVMRLVQEKLVARKPHAGTRVIRQAPASVPTRLGLDACAYIYPSNQHEGIWRAGRGFELAAHEAKRRTLMLSTESDFRKEAEIVRRERA